MNSFKIITGMYKVHTLDEIPLQQTESTVCENYLGFAPYNTEKG